MNNESMVQKWQKQGDDLLQIKKLNRISEGAQPTE